MKKIIPFLFAPLSLAVTASEAADLRLVDVASLPDCDQISESVLRADVPYHCLDSSYAAHMEKERTAAPTRFIAFNNQATTFKLNNKGAYLTRFRVEYDWYDYTTGIRHRSSYSTGDILAGQSRAITLGANTTHAFFDVVLDNFVGWKPVFTDFINPIEVKYRTPNGNNQVQWDVWGTIFNAPSKRVQPSGTYNFQEKDYVMLYKNSDWDADQTSLGIAIDQNMANLHIVEAQYLGDKIQSWSIPEGWKERFFEEPNFQGGYFTRTGGKGNDEIMRNKISSIQILERR